MEKQEKQSVSSFVKGFSYPFSSLGFINTHPGLVRFILIPFIINVVVFCLVIYFGFGFFQEIVLAKIPQAEAWYWFLLEYFMIALGILITLVLVFFTFTVTGCLIASPFNDLLSERTEEILRGDKKEELFSWRLFFGDVKRTLLTETKKIAVFGGGMLLLFMLNFIPGFGSLVYSVLSVIWIIFFLIVEYTGYTLSRKRLMFKEQRRIVLTRLPLMCGFGTALFCILAIPFLQFICIPVGVVGATRMLVENKLVDEK